MPLIESSSFRPPVLWRNRHVQTVLPHLLPAPRGPAYHRERLELADGDFVDLDLARVGAETALLLLHGMESCSRAPTCSVWRRPRTRRVTTPWP